MKVCKTYGLSEKFTENMALLEEHNIQYYNAHESKLGQRYLAIEKMTKNFMKHHKVSMIVGSLLFTLLHPKKMQKAQKYYAGWFGKPCPIKIQKKK